jgi:hypothetical protein
MITDRSSMSAACVVLSIIWAFCALLSAIAGLHFVLNSSRDDAFPWVVFTVIALLVSESALFVSEYYRRQRLADFLESQRALKRSGLSIEVRTFSIHGEIP